MPSLAGLPVIFLCFPGTHVPGSRQPRTPKAGVQGCLSAPLRGCIVVAFCRDGTPRCLRSGIIIPTAMRPTLTEIPASLPPVGNSAPCLLDPYFEYCIIPEIGAPMAGLGNAGGHSRNRRPAHARGSTIAQPRRGGRPQAKARHVSAGKAYKSITSPEGTAPWLTNTPMSSCM